MTTRLQPNVERLQEALSLALEDRSKGYQDLVSNSNVLLLEMKKRKQWKPFSGPKIRERLLYNESGTYTRYSGYQYLNPKPVELINDAEFEPKMAAVSVTISNDEILKNSGPNQLKDLLTTHLEAAEQELDDRFTEDLHSDGTADAGKQVGGLQLAIPRVTNAGTYGGIDRSANAIWQTSSYDADTFLAGESQVTKDNIKRFYDRVAIERSRGKKGPDLILASQEHYLAYQEHLEDIQRISNTSDKGMGGFVALEYVGGGRRMPIVLEGGIGTAMPSNLSYFIDVDSLKFRYHPQRNFSKIGSKQMPVNQDAIVQHIGFMGELTMCNPLHNAVLYDSDLAS